ncbi:MAG: hypothetical protein V3T33_09265 [Myxococcota bacterium]
MSDTGEQSEARTAPVGEDRVSCDFCGEIVDNVRRVALDGDYERLRTPHQVRYACPSCSENKERQRQRG